MDMGGSPAQEVGFHCHRFEKLQMGETCLGLKTHAL